MNQRAEKARSRRLPMGRAGVAAMRTAGVMTAVALVVGCGGSDPETDDRAEAAPPATSESAAASPSALRAEDFVLTEGPETAGFTGTPPAPDSEESADLRQVAACLKIPETALETDAAALDHARGMQFAYQGARFPKVSSTASILPADVVGSDRAIFEKDNFASCLGQFLDQEIAGTVPGGTADIVSAEEPATLPPGATGAVDAVAVLSDASGKANVFYTFVFVLEDQVESTLMLANVGSPTPPQIVNAMVGQVAEKVHNQ